MSGRLQRPDAGVDGEGEAAVALAGRVEDCVGDGGGGADDTDLSASPFMPMG